MQRIFLSSKPQAQIDMALWPIFLFADSNNSGGQPRPWQVETQKVDIGLLYRWMLVGLQGACEKGVIIATR